MGLSTVMASTIILYVMLVVIGAVAGVAITALKGLSKGLNACMSILESDRIELRGVSYNEALLEVRLNATNLGSRVIYDYPHFDVIVYYTNILGGSVVYYAPFRGGYLDYLGYHPPGWYVYGVYDSTGSLHEYTSSTPRYWDPSTTLEVVVVLPSTPAPGSLVTVTLATPRGGRVMASMTWG